MISFFNGSKMGEKIKDWSKAFSFLTDLILNQKKGEEL